MWLVAAILGNESSLNLTELNQSNHTAILPSSQKGPLDSTDLECKFPGAAPSSTVLTAKRVPTLGRRSGSIS